MNHNYAFQMLSGKRERGKNLIFLCFVVHYIHTPAYTMWHHLNSKLYLFEAKSMCVMFIVWIYVFLVEYCVRGTTWKISLPFQGVMVIYFELYWVRQITHSHRHLFGTWKCDGMGLYEALGLKHLHWNISEVFVF